MATVARMLCRFSAIVLVMCVKGESVTNFVISLRVEQVHINYKFYFRLYKSKQSVNLSDLHPKLSEYSFDTRQHEETLFWASLLTPHSPVWVEVYSSRNATVAATSSIC